MKRLSLVSAVAVAVLLVTLLAPLTAPVAKAQQPPVETSTMYVGTIGWGPRRADSVRAYDTGSGELIFNVYDTLIFTKGEIYWEFEPCLSKNVPDREEGTIQEITKTVSSTDVNISDPVGSHWSDGSVCIGWVDNDASGTLSVPDQLYMVESDGKYRTWQVIDFDAGPPVSVTLYRERWIFNIRTKDDAGNPIYFVDEGGSIVGTFNASDAEYSLERGLVQDQYGSPMWMFYKPLFGQMNSDPWDTGNPTDAMNLAHLIDDAIEVEVVGDEQYLIINLGMRFPEVAFKQILSQTWAAMVDKEFSIGIGCWDGNLFFDSAPGLTPVEGEVLGFTWNRKKKELLGWTWNKVVGEFVGVGDGRTKEFTLAHAPVVEGSETITVSGVPQTRDVDYTINYETGTITFTTAPGLGKVIYADYTWIQTEFATANAPIVEGSETVYRNGTALTRNTDYTIDYAKGEITLITGTEAKYNVTIDYTWIRKKFNTKFWPVEEGSEKIYMDGTTLVKDANYTIKYSTGAIKLNPGVGEDQNYTLKIDYRYIGGFPDWFETGKPVTWWRHISRSPYDRTTPITRPPGVYFTNGYRYVGTGPYRVITFDAVNLKVEFVKNEHYWKGWSGKHLDKIVIRYIADWTPRKNAFLAGEIDVCAVPRANMYELLDPVTGEPTTPGIITIKKISPALSMDAIHFTFTVVEESPYIAKRADTGEKLPLFFNNTHVRKAFCYAFNKTAYIEDAWFKEAMVRNSPLVYGLVPDYYNPKMPGYDINFEAAKNELQQVVFADGRTLWETGFMIILAYNTGNDQRRIACEMIADFFEALSTYGGRTGPPFTVTVVEIDWPTYLEMFEMYELPIWSIGWLADFADADNFARPYMHSWGDFAYFQNYTADNGWGTRKDWLIDMALLTPDGDARKALYYELQDIYYKDAPSLPISIPIGRRWCWYWVKGWYYNALYPAQYYYSMYKENTCWFNVAGAEQAGQPGIPDTITNLKDTVYLINHFMATAPEPGKPVHPLWVGTYGVGGVDPYGDRICNIKDVVYSIIHFNHREQP